MADKNFKVKNNIVVNDVEIDPSSPIAEQILRYNGTKFISANSGIPTGGFEGQILSKVTDTSYDTQWIDNFADQLRVTCKNGTESQINKGTAVMAVGSAGDLIEIEPAVADGSVAVKYMLGVASENIPGDGEGYVTLVGPVAGIDTNAYTVGTILYIDPSTPGQFTSTEPTAPDIDLPLAIVVKQNSSAGSIFVRMWSQGAKLGELQDVNVTGVTDGQVLSYDSATATWVPGTVSGVGAAKITVSDTPPSSPSVGDLWFESDTGDIFVYYDSYWIEIAGEQGPTGPAGATGAQGDWSLSQTVETKTGAYTIVSGDAGKIIRMNAAADFTVNSSTGFSIGQRVDVIRMAADACNIVQGAGATVSATPGLKLRDQYSAASIVCVEANVYYVIGDLSA